METYTTLRAFADSWMLLGMFLFFVGMVIWVFLPRNRSHQADSADIPFRYEDRPLRDEPSAREETL